MKKRGVYMKVEKIEILKNKLNNEIERGCPYEQILKTSKEIDEMLVKYYLEEIKDIT